MSVEPNHDQKIHIFLNVVGENRSLTELVSSVDVNELMDRQVFGFKTKQNNEVPSLIEFD